MRKNQSIARQAFVPISFGVAAVICASAIAGVAYIRNTLATQTQKQLQKFVLERVERERSLFSLVASNLTIYRDTVLAEWQEAEDVGLNPRTEFKRYYQRDPDGAIRNRPEYPFNEYAAIFMDDEIALTDDLMLRASVLLELETAFGRSWNGQFPNLYFVGKENWSIGYWPDTDWPSQTDPTDYYEIGEEWFTVGTPENNPGKGLVFTGVLYDSSADDWYVSAVMPVYIDRDTDTERFVGIVGQDLDLNNIVQRTLNETLGAETYNIIFRRDGRLIAHPKLIEDIKAAEGEYFLTEIDNVELKALFETVTRAGTNEVVIDFPTGNAFLGVSIIPETGWYFVTVYPKSLLNAAATQAGFGVVVAGIVALGVSLIILSQIMQRRLTQPLQAVTGTIQKIGEGDLLTRVAVNGDNELAILGSTVNQMAEQLQQQLAAQEARTQEQVILAKITGARVENAEDLKTVFNAALADALSFLKADRVVIYRFIREDRSDYLSYEAIQPDLPSALDQEPIGDLTPQELLENYQESPVIAIPDVIRANATPSVRALFDRLQVQAQLTVPLVAQSELYGLLVAHHCLQTHAWENAEIGFLKEMAIRIGVVIERISLVELQGATIAEEEQRKAKEALQLRALQLVKEVDPISRGDLTIRAQVTEDEIGTIADSYNNTVESLREIVTQVQAAASQVSETTETNTVSIQELFVEAKHQADEITSVHQQIQKMEALSEDVSASAQQAEAAVKQTLATVEAGDTAMNLTVEGIAKMSDTVSEATKQVQRLGDSSRRISKVVKLISSFAAQTNVLALNASIEAARAGEEGRGFAVVADEVRSLAQQSAEATAEIAKIVEEIQLSIQETIQAMEVGSEQVATNTETVETTRQSLTQIVEASNQINNLVEVISQAANVQSQSAQEVNQTITSVAATAQKTSSSAEEVSVSFEELHAVAQQLQERMSQFKVPG